jgi:hypothetical protein
MDNGVVLISHGDVLSEATEIQNRIRDVQQRAVTMSAVIATILGIGLPLIAQQQTRHYFHRIPILLLSISFLLFYSVFTRGIATINLTKIELEQDGQKQLLKIRDSYEPTFIEKLISIQYTRYIDSPKDIRLRLDKTLLWRTSLSQWAHSFFIAAILAEVYKIIYPHNNTKGTILLCIAVVLLILFNKYFVFYKVTGKHTETVTLNKDGSSPKRNGN